MACLVAEKGEKVEYSTHSKTHYRSSLKNTWTFVDLLITHMIFSQNSDAILSKMNLRGTEKRKRTVDLAMAVLIIPECKLSTNLNCKRMVQL